MNKLTIFVAALGLALPAVASSGDEGYYSGSFVRMSYVQGDVFLQRAGDLGYEKGEVNLAVVEGDKLGTRDGRAELHFGRRNYLRADGNTQVEFVNLPREDGEGVKLHLFAGGIFLRIGSLEMEKEFEVHTPDASFYILAEGLYRFEVRENRETEVCVHEGLVEAAGEQGSIKVESDERLLASNGNLGSHLSVSYTREDDFADWNESRDSLHNRYVGRSYLPSEINEYESELDEHGRWVYERPYGYAWVPSIVHSDWRPYYYGRWVWYPIIGWTWVSHEPWGWCTYHYGRWHWRLGLGWHWIPTSRWGPAWIHWYHGYDYIAWCPLSYYNRPVVIVNNYFYDRYHGDDYPLNSRALTVIHKNQLQSPSISRAALSQAEITGVGKISLKAAQPGIRPVLRNSLAERSAAAGVFSGQQIRRVDKNFDPAGGTVSPSGLRSTGVGSLSRSSGTPGVQSRGSISQREAAPSGIRPSSAGRDQKNDSTLNQSSKRTVTSFPSSLFKPRSTDSPSTEPGGVITPRKIRSESDPKIRSEGYTSRSRIKSYMPSEQPSPSPRSSVSSSWGGNIKSVEPGSRVVRQWNRDESRSSRSISSPSNSGRIRSSMRENPGYSRSRAAESSSTPSLSGFFRKFSSSRQESSQIKSPSSSGFSSSRSVAVPRQSYASPSYSSGSSSRSASPQGSSSSRSLPGKVVKKD